MNLQSRSVAPAIAGLMLFVFTAPEALGQELEPNRASDRRPLLENPLADWGQNYTNWVEISVGGVIEQHAPQGWEAEFQRRHQIPTDVFGGIESLHLEEDLGKKRHLVLDGRGIFDNHDYNLSLEVSQDDLGYVRAGYREFRTWYDRHGGFYPIGDIWLTPFYRDVAVDRGEIWFEAGLRKPNIPQVTFRYEHDFRDGLKDSTSWGDYNLNIGQTSAANLKSIVPSFLDLDEKRDTFALDVKHTVGQTDFGVGVRYDLIDQDNERKILRRPGEVPPVATPGSERALTQKDGVDTDSFSAHAFSQTQIKENLLFTAGAAFTTLDTDLEGSRIYGAGFDVGYDPLFGRRQRFDEGFLDLSGGSRRYEYLANLNLQFTPIQNLSLIPSVRIQEDNQHGTSDYIATNVGPGPGFAPSATSTEDYSDQNNLDVSEAFEARYSGLTNWLLYARGEWTESNGKLFEKETAFGTNFATDVLQNKDIDRFTQKYVAGVNWYPLRRLNFSAQYYHKIHNVDYENRLGPPPTAYPGFLQEEDFETDDMNARVTLRPLNTVTLVSRYDFQLSTIDTVGDSLSKIQSAETTSHIFSESASWTPLSWLYLQANLNYALDDTETPANYLGGAARNLVLKSQNNYWNASALAGLALDEKTDLQVQYFYYRANNYRNNAAVGMPYGAGAEENGVTATVARQLTSALRLTLKYGFFTNHDETYGGHQNYEAHLVYSSLQYRF